ncbi:Ger(x)C family spore germination protein [Metabacillus sp. Hm71]|uniref:Ger(x)C family spore germination protein n=1 Tax=Metabacillus sp. Hm71 TaxID=3450743 RepID=UPI003F422F28
MKKMFPLIILVVLFLTGCVEQEIIDDVNLVTVTGFDKIEKDKIRGTAIINTYLKDQPVQDYQLVESSELSRDILSDMQKKSPDPLVLGKLQVVLFGEALSRSGITDLVDTLQRDASISERLLLAVTRDEAKSVLEADFGTQGASRFLSSLILHNNLHRDLPKSNLHLFLYQYYSKGQDPFLPILSKKGKDVLIDGLALFDDVKLVGEISNEKLLFFKILADQYSKGSYTLNIPDSKEKAGIRSISSSRKLNLISLNPLKVEISAHVEGYINEYTGRKITQEVIKKAEKAFKDEIEKESLALIDKFKELQIDPLGIGDDIRSQSRDFDISNWREEIKDLNVDVKADVLISETGVID